MDSLTPYALGIVAEGGSLYGMYVQSAARCTQSLETLYGAEPHFVVVVVIASSKSFYFGQSCSRIGRPAIVSEKREESSLQFPDE